MTLLAAARAQALTALADPAVSTVRILLLRDRLTRGEFNGRSCKSCFFGILGGETDEGYNSLREDLKMATAPERFRENPIEEFCALVFMGSTWEVPYSRMLIDWVNIELDRRQAERRSARGESTSILMEMTEDEVDEGLIIAEVDELLIETRLLELQETFV